MTCQCTDPTFDKAQAALFQIASKLSELVAHVGSLAGAIAQLSEAVSATVEQNCTPAELEEIIAGTLETGGGCSTVGDVGPDHGRTVPQCRARAIEAGEGGPPC